MSSNIAVGIMFDTDYIVKNSGPGGTCGAPLPVKDPQRCIYMVADYDHEINGHGSAELNIRANRGDDIGPVNTTCPVNNFLLLLAYENNTGAIRKNSRHFSASERKCHN